MPERGAVAQATVVQLRQGERLQHMQPLPTLKFFHVCTRPLCGCAAFSASVAVFLSFHFRPGGSVPRNSYASSLACFVCGHCFCF